MTDKVVPANPFLQPLKLPFQAIPFTEISLPHYSEAFDKAFEEGRKEIKALIENPEPPTFKNTIEALEKSGKLLTLVEGVFFNLLHAESSKEMEQLAQELSPKLTQYSNEILHNAKLFERIAFVKANEKGQTAEEQRLIDETYDSFVRAGANLSEEDKAKLGKLEEQLNICSLTFANHLREETNAYQLLLDEAEVEGLPELHKEQAKQLAQEKGKEGYLFTLQAPSYIPFITYVKSRERRKEVYLAYNTRCKKENTFNNVALVQQIVNLRQEISKLLGYADYATYRLSKRMASKSENVYKLLNQLHQAYLPYAQEEINALKKLAKEEEGEGFELQAWDFAYYSHKLKQKIYDFNPDDLRPYFELSQVIKGVFGLATKLYGITFKEASSIPVYHKDVKVYEVAEQDGNFLALLYVDFYPRESKQGGAWMTNFKEQYKENGKDFRPYVSLVMNFTPSTIERPSLLTLDEVKTFLHEFGHALHGIFASSTYSYFSGTNVYRDFVELPSQFMENFATEEEFLKTFAYHYKTKELIPSSLIQKIKESENFNVGFACLRQLTFGFLDMAFHTLQNPLTEDILAFEKKQINFLQLLPLVEECCIVTQFSHIMAGGYAAGYYGYKWAEVLDADAFSIFQQKGIFNKEVASRFRCTILSRGGEEHPMKLYQDFAGREPNIKALLQRDGINES